MHAPSESINPGRLTKPCKPESRLFKKRAPVSKIPTPRPHVAGLRVPGHSRRGTEPRRKPPHPCDQDPAPAPHPPSRRLKPLSPRSYSPSSSVSAGGTRPSRPRSRSSSVMRSNWMSPPAIKSDWPRSAVGAKAGTASDSGSNFDMLLQGMDEIFLQVFWSQRAFSDFAQRHDSIFIIVAVYRDLSTRRNHARPMARKRAQSGFPPCQCSLQPLRVPYVLSFVPTIVFLGRFRLFMRGSLQDSRNRPESVKLLCEPHNFGQGCQPSLQQPAAIVLFYAIELIYRTSL